MRCTEKIRVNLREMKHCIDKTLILPGKYWLGVRLGSYKEQLHYGSVLTWVSILFLNLLYSKFNFS